VYITVHFVQETNIRFTTRLSVFVGRTEIVNSLLRYLDLLLSHDTRRALVGHRKIINSIRCFFNTLSFLEVETPMMSMIAGGATVRPFD
jgi:aspartyl-tRNA synthetase